MSDEVGERRTEQSEILEAIQVVGATVDGHIRAHVKRDADGDRKLEMILEVIHGKLTDEVDIDGNLVREPSAFQIAATRGFKPPRQRWTIGNKITLVGILATLLGTIIVAIS